MLLSLVVAELQAQRRHELDALWSKLAGIFHRLEQAQGTPQLRALFGRPWLVAVTMRDDDVEINLMSLVDDVAIHSLADLLKSRPRRRARILRWCRLRRHRLP